MKYFKAFGVYFITWHSFAEFMLDKYGMHIVDPNFNIVDREVQGALLNIARDMENKYYENV